MNITDEEITLLLNTTSARAWDAACDAIKTARDGRYPPDWWPKIMQSGLAQDIMSSWEKPGSPEIKLEFVE